MKTTLMQQLHHHCHQEYFYNQYRYNLDCLYFVVLRVLFKWILFIAIG